MAWSTICFGQVLSRLFEACAPKTCRMQHQLQGMISKARGRGGVAASDPLRKSKGDDGRLYVLEDPRDFGKYHVLSDREVAEEERRSLELAYAKAGEKEKKPGPLRVSSSSPKASSKRWSATIDDKAGAQTKVHDFLNSTRTSGDYKAGSKSPPSSPTYKKVVSNIGRSLINESQEKLPPRPVSAIALSRSAGGGGSGQQQQQQEQYEARGRPATTGGEARGSSQQEVDSSNSPSGANGAVRRSHSASSKTRLYDNEAYILRREWAAAREKAEREEREAYGAELQLRTLRASKNGKEFEAMRKRAEKCHERNVQKSLAKKEKEDAAEAKEAQDRLEARRAHLNKQLSKNGELSWKEMLEQQEMRRKENCEKHKQELLVKSRAPAGAFRDADNKRDKLKAATEEVDYAFKAEDPQKVAAKLAKMQRQWEAQQEAKKKLVAERDAAKRLALSGKLRKPSQVKSMEDREAEAKARHAKREEERRKKDEAEDLKRKEDEKRRAEKLANIKIPEEAQRLTKSAKNRADMVLKMKNDEKDRIAREAREQARKRLVVAEMGRTLKVIIDQREQERKEKLGSFTELSGSEHKAAEAAKALRAEYKKRRQENEARLRDVVNSRPSLIERHEQVSFFFLLSCLSSPLLSFPFAHSPLLITHTNQQPTTNIAANQAMATRKAAVAGLAKIHAAVKSATGDKYSLDDDDLFNDTEKVRLTSRSEG